MNITEEQRMESRTFYKEALELLTESNASYMIGGAFAVFHYTGIYRDTKDLDVFCKFREYPKILRTFEAKGFDIQLTDARWLAKIFKGEYYIDVIFDTPSNICRVDDSWLEHAIKVELFGSEVLIISAEELIWNKIYVQNRERFDGADVNHIILKAGKNLDWKRLLDRMDQHWHLLLSQLLNFQFVYPADYHSIVPKWLFDELIDRATEQYNLPEAGERVCRGPLIDQTQYGIDIKEWNYKALTMKTI